LWWTKWRWGRFSPITSASPANLHSTNLSTITITYHPGLVQKASKWPQYPKSHRTNTKKIKWRWGRFSLSTLVSPANLYSINFSTITITCHLGLVQ
jgi:hypothetical protein